MPDTVPFWIHSFSNSEDTLDEARGKPGTPPTSLWDQEFADQHAGRRRQPTPQTPLPSLDSKPPTTKRITKAQLDARNAHQTPTKPRRSIVEKTIDGVQITVLTRAN